MKIKSDNISTPTFTVCLAGGGESCLTGNVDSLNLLCLTPCSKVPERLPTHVLTRGVRMMMASKTRPYLSHVSRYSGTLSSLCPAANIANLSPEKPTLALKFYSLSSAIKRLHFSILQISEDIITKYLIQIPATLLSQ